MRRLSSTPPVATSTVQAGVGVGSQDQQQEKQVRELGEGRIEDKQEKASEEMIFCSSFFVGLTFPNSVRIIDLTPTIQVCASLLALVICFLT
jgi:hypothetical protein